MSKKKSSKRDGRSKKGYFLFMKNHYSPKNGIGSGVPFDRNWKNLLKFMYKMNLSEVKLHQLTNVEMYQLLCYHRDLEKSSKRFRQLDAASESYYQYIRYTIGCY